MNSENRTKIHEGLEKMKTLFSSPGVWRKYNYAYNKHDESVSPIGEDACQWCLVGATHYVGTETEIVYELQCILQQSLPDDFIAMSWFNDHDETELVDIIEVIDQSIVSLLHSVDE